MITEHRSENKVKNVRWDKIRSKTYQIGQNKVKNVRQKEKRL
jgi:hypothetical protein